MSTRVEIQPGEIRKGDLIRAERNHNEDATEYRAMKNGAFAGDWSGWTYYLLDRPKPAVVLPNTPTLGWLNNSPHLLAIWVDSSDGAARPPAIRPTCIPTGFDDGHITAFTEAVAVPKSALDELRGIFAASGATYPRDQAAIDVFLAAVGEASTR